MGFAQSAVDQASDGQNEVRLAFGSKNDLFGFKVLRNRRFGIWEDGAAFLLCVEVTAVAIPQQLSYFSPHEWLVSEFITVNGIQDENFIGVGRRFLPDILKMKSDGRLFLLFVDEILRRRYFAWRKPSALTGTKSFVGFFHCK